jgi:hypothetical protein
MGRVIELRKPEPVTLRPRTVEVDRELAANLLRVLFELIEPQPLAAVNEGLLLQTVSRLSFCLFELICKQDDAHAK